MFAFLSEPLSHMLFSLGYRAGVSIGVVSPKSHGFLSGWGAAFSLNARHRLEPGAVVQESTAVHISVGTQGANPSISTQVGALRRLLLKSESGAFRDIANVSDLLLHMRFELTFTLGKSNSGYRSTEC